MSFKSVTSKIAASLLGIALVLGSLYAEWIVLHQKPIGLNLAWSFIGTLLLGAVLIVPAELYAAAQHAIALYKDWKSAPK